MTEIKKEDILCYSLEPNQRYSISSIKCPKCGGETHMCFHYAPDYDAKKDDLTVRFGGYCRNCNSNINLSHNFVFIGLTAEIVEPESNEDEDEDEEDDSYSFGWKTWRV